MRTKIYFFTGTGNSLSIAKEICNKIPQCELVSIPKEYEKKNPISDCEKVGFVFPLHYAGLPKIVFDFVNKFDVSKSTYFFSIVTHAGDMTTWPFIQLEKILKERSKKLNAGFSLIMPNNYILGYETHSEARQKKMFKEASIKSTQIAEDIKNQVENLNLKIDEKRKSGSAKFNEQFREEVNESDTSFYADDKC
ncbi:MAG: EFR1 family ferrodoxin, partial [Candidatus Lokiarchaeota archaeon]|nr:EFR1 family ferrodoxin [Candidatus Lokiarchaeota archaeon]